MGEFDDILGAFNSDEKQQNKKKMLYELDNVYKTLGEKELIKDLVAQGYELGEFNTPQKLLDKVHAKDIKSISKAGDNIVRVDFGEVIGECVDQITGKAVPTTKAIIHMGKDGAHIVPTKP